MATFDEILPKLKNGEKVYRKSWDNIKFIYLKNGTVYTDTDERFTFDNNVLRDDWEVYKEVDYDYIILNKIPCWFWTDDFESRRLGFLIIYDKDDHKWFGCDTKNGYDSHRYCQPVKRNELIFYNDIFK